MKTFMAVVTVIGIIIAAGVMLYAQLERHSIPTAARR